MKNNPSKLRTYALLVCAAVMSACANPGYNNNPSQQITNARVGCPAATDFFAVYFSLHLQPFNESQDARITKELFRSYCNSLPAPGRVFFTADLVGAELRKMPIGIRVVEQEVNDGDEGDGENFKDLRTILEVLPKTYPKGVIESDFELDENGYYAVYLIRGGKDAASEENKLRIPVYVGVEPSAVTRILTLLGIASGLGLIGFAGFRYMRSGMVP
jgi:hypothetical protein